MFCNRWSIILITSFGVLTVSLSAPRARGADDADPERIDQTLESELLDDLKNDLFEGLEEELSEKPWQGQDDLGEDVHQADEKDPLVRIGRRMQDVQERIARAGSPRETQQLQEKIVADVEELIRQARQRNKQSSSGASSGKAGSRRSKVRQPKRQSAGSSRRDSRKPASDSTGRLGRAESAQVDREAMREMLRDLWGHLPERTREQMLQSSEDKFLPKYEVLIEKYFRRLAEEPDPLNSDR